MEPTRAEPAGADLNLRIFQPLGRWMADERGKDALARVMATAGLPETSLDGRNEWVSLDRVEALLAAARELMRDDEELKLACAYRFRQDAYVGLRLAVWATSPRVLYRRAARTIGLVSAIGTYENVPEGRHGIRVVYRSARSESRLMCLSRQAQVAVFPTLWDLPPAALKEGDCIARGDETCTYHLRIFQHRRWLPTLLGLVAGGAVTAALAAMHVPDPAPWLLLPLIGAGAGSIFELLRTHRANLSLGLEINEALRETAREEADARRELLALQQREREWGKLVEEQLAERHVALQQLVDGLERMQKQRVVAIRGVSHDLRNPIAILKANNEYLEEAVDPEHGAVFEDQRNAIERLEQLVHKLLETAMLDTAFAPGKSAKLDTAAVTERLRRTLRALAHGKGLRISVFATREAPESIETDPLVFDRVVDNLLTNAVKYTERGSILVEVGGTPGFLSLKVSDTGRGIDPDQIARIFDPGGSDKATRAASSSGVGLSVVVQLLGQSGGRLEVMSKPGVGTTFWVHLPVVPKPPSSRGSDRREPMSKLVDRVVTIRRLQAE